MMDTEPSCRTNPLRRSTTLFGAAMMAIAVVGGGYYAVRDYGSGRESSFGAAEEEGLPPASKFGGDYRKWERPLVSLVLSGQMHGYTMPCGCSFPQYGGLVRRYNFIESLRAGPGGKTGWPVVGIDLGELAAGDNLDPNDLDSPPMRVQGSREQNLLKFDLSMKALATMNYRAVGIGKSELLSPLGEALALTYDKKRPYPRLLALTLAETGPGEFFNDLNVRPYEIVDTVTPKIGIISMIGPDFRVADDIKNTDNKFLSNQDELPKALKAFADAGVEIGVILQHEYPNLDKGIQGFKRMKALDNNRRKQAKVIAEYCAEMRKQNPKIPAIQLMMILTKEPEPPMVMETLDPALPTQIVEIGHKGKYVGLVGVYRDGNAFRMQYQIVLMGPDWDTKKGEEDKNPVIAQMQQYADAVKNQNLMAKSLRSPHYIQMQGNGPGLRASFVGSERCGDCHTEAYNVWSGNNNIDRKLWHNIATATLQNEKFPSGRQFDPECIVCHSVGFKYPSGYNDPVDIAQWPKRDTNPIDPKLLAKHNAKLSGVGCESCHGPGSLHVNNPQNAEVRKLMNPFAPSKEERALEQELKRNPGDAAKRNAFNQLNHRRMANLEQQLCVKCHDHENDVHWGQKDDAKNIDHTIFAKWARIIHRTPDPVNNNGNAPPQGNVGPVEFKLDVNKLGGAPIPEFRIEVEIDKKK